MTKATVTDLFDLAAAVAWFVAFAAGTPTAAHFPITPPCQVYVNRK